MLSQLNLRCDSWIIQWDLGVHLLLLCCFESSVMAMLIICYSITHSLPFSPIWRAIVYHILYIYIMLLPSSVHIENYHINPRLSIPICLGRWQHHPYFEISYIFRLWMAKRGPETETIFSIKMKKKLGQNGGAVCYVATFSRVPNVSIAVLTRIKGNEWINYLLHRNSDQNNTCIWTASTCWAYELAKLFEQFKPVAWQAGKSASEKQKFPIYLYCYVVDKLYTYLLINE